MPSDCRPSISIASSTKAEAGASRVNDGDASVLKVAVAIAKTTTAIDNMNLNFAERLREGKIQRARLMDIIDLTP